MNGEGPVRFVPRNLSHTRLFGAYLAVHAIDDAICFLHGGEGCKTKTQLHLVFHDWFRESHNRRIWTDIKDADFIKGTAGRMESVVRTWIERRNPAIAFVLTASFIEVSGEDMAGAVEQIDQSVPCPVRYLSTAGFEGDLYSGYGDVVVETLRTMDWSVEPEGGVNIVGHFFDRYERDRLADVAQLEQLCRGAGAPARAVFLSGRPLAMLGQAVKARANVVMPYLAHRADEIARITGRPTVVTDLPVGLHGSANWVRQVAGIAGADLGQAESYIEGELTRVVRPLDCLVARTGDADARRRFALFADVPLAAALAAFLCDLEMDAEIVGLLDRTLGGPEAFTSAFERLCPAAASLPHILTDPSRDAVIKTTAGLVPLPDLVLGTSVELLDLAHMGVPSLEVGFPSFARHGLYPIPTLGFDGACALGQRILDALSRVH